MVPANPHSAPHSLSCPAGGIRESDQETDDGFDDKEKTDETDETDDHCVDQEESERVIRKHMSTVMTGGAVGPGDQGCRASIQYNTQIQIQIHIHKNRNTPKVMTPRAVSTG